MGKHIGVLAFPFTSHPPTLLGLVRRLASAAPDAKFSFFSTANSNSFLFSAQSPGGVLGNLKSYDVADGVPVGHVLSGNPAEADMAEEMGVPWVPFWIAGLSALCVHLHTDAIRQTMGVRGHEDQTLNFIPGLSAMTFQDLPGEIVSGNLDSPPSLMLHKMGLTLPRATAIVANSFEELDPVVATHLKSKLPKLLCVAPSALTSSPDELNSDVNGCLSWLDKQKAKSVAYISFGSMLAPSPDEHVALAETLQATGVAFLWSIKDNSKKNFARRISREDEREWKSSSMGSPDPSLSTPFSWSAHHTWRLELSDGEHCRRGAHDLQAIFFANNTLNSRAIEDVWGIGVGLPGGVLTKKWIKGSPRTSFGAAREDDDRKNWCPQKALDKGH
ncbi:Anthocyanidin 3-O-glucosyltransferase 2 [Vitis vinifera]|uniref:Anthocyanidin 3-O-glucosyltransferase 2 n=1 Tax=Vitis vinifera TaxID=29760 RepID=A0A438DIZ5_VITVI|nr:Anthocyanidin 3-O-glucosyltransferase 2 [Vitis vinifera]